MVGVRRGAGDAWWGVVEKAEEADGLLEEALKAVREEKRCTRLEGCQQSVVRCYCLDAPHVVEADNENLYGECYPEAQRRLRGALTLVCKEVDATDGLLNLQALLELASFDIPEADGLVVRATDQALATQ